MRTPPLPADWFSELALGASFVAGFMIQVACCNAPLMGDGLTPPCPSSVAKSLFAVDDAQLIRLVAKAGHAAQTVHTQLTPLQRAGHRAMDIFYEGIVEPDIALDAVRSALEIHIKHRPLAFM